MSSNFDEISDSITQQQIRIYQNQQQRKKKFSDCLQSYLSHLNKQIAQLNSTELQNDQRNSNISSIFENVYQRIMTSSQIMLRKVKETCFEKKLFWDKLIKNNAQMSDLQLKKDFYLQKRSAQDRYYEAIEAQKTKKISYKLLLGKLKPHQNLKQWQQNNRKLQQQVTNGTKTLQSWNIANQKKLNSQFYDQTLLQSNQNNYFINQFATQPQTHQLPWARTPLTSQRNNTNQILKKFQIKR